MPEPRRRRVRVPRGAPGRRRRVMSGKRGPSDSSFGPTSGEAPWRLTWSEIETSCPGSKSSVDPARRVREHERADPEPAEHAHAEHDPLRRESLVEMRAPAHDRDRHAADVPSDERAGVADRGRDGPAGDLGVRDLDRRRRARRRSRRARCRARRRRAGSSVGLAPESARPRRRALTPSPRRRRLS